jgi:hypothetical protein
LHSKWNFGMLLKNHNKAHWGEGQMKSFLVAFLFLVGLSGEASACSITFVPFVEGKTVETRMTVKSGANCGGAYTSPGPVESQTLTQRPTHGRVEMSGATATYRSAKGYVGSDAFAITMRGKDTRNNPQVKSVRVLVTVTP